MSSFITIIDTSTGPVRCHLSIAPPRRVIPAAEKHKWSRKPERGQTARCLKCGIVKCYRMDYETVYRLPDSTEILTERPSCFKPEATKPAALIS